jgi:hypothetical protein
MMLMMMIGGVVWCVGGAVAVLAGGLSVKRERERVQYRRRVFDGGRRT